MQNGGGRRTESGETETLTSYNANVGKTEKLKLGNAEPTRWRPREAKQRVNTAEELLLLQSADAQERADISAALAEADADISSGRLRSPEEIRCSLGL